MSIPAPHDLNGSANIGAPAIAPVKRGRSAVIALGTGMCLLLAVIAFSLTGSTKRAPPPAGVAAAAAMPPLPEPVRAPRSYYASPTGVRSNDGTEAQPLDLASALSADSPLRGGDTLWLRAGVYRGAFVSEIEGRPDAAIYVKQYPGERVVLDGAGFSAATLAIGGADVWFWGFEITNSDGTRVFDTPGEADNRRAVAVRVLAPRTRYINLVVRDALTGFSISDDAENTELYGCLIYNNGVRDPRGGYGHGLYAEPGRGVTKVIDVVTFDNQGRGVNIAGERATPSVLVFEGLVSFNNGQPATDDSAYKLENLFVSGAADLTLIDSHLYHALGTTGLNLSLGVPEARAGKLTMTGNAIVGGSMSMRVASWREAHVTENLVYVQSSPTPESDQTIASLQTPADATRGYVWRANRYIDRTQRAYPFVFNGVANAFGGGNLKFSEWQQATGFDGNSHYSREQLSGVQVHVRENRYDRTRWQVVVYNWAAQDAVAVALPSTSLRRGDRFEVLDVARTFDAPILTGTYDGRAISIPMGRATRRASRTALERTSADITPQFAVFVIRKLAAAAAAPAR